MTPTGSQGTNLTETVIFDVPWRTSCRPAGKADQAPRASIKMRCLEAGEDWCVRTRTLQGSHRLLEALRVSNRMKHHLGVQHWCVQGRPLERPMWDACSGAPLFLLGGLRNDLAAGKGFCDTLQAADRAPCNRVRKLRDVVLDSKAEEPLAAVANLMVCL